MFSTLKRLDVALLITEPVQFSDLGSHGSLETGRGGRQNPELVTIIGTLTLLLLHAVINQKYS